MICEMIKRLIVVESCFVYKCSNSYLLLKLLIKCSYNLVVRLDVYMLLLFFCMMCSVNVFFCCRYLFINCWNFFFLWNFFLLCSFFFVIFLFFKLGFIFNNFLMNSILLIGKNMCYNYKIKFL